MTFVMTPPTGRRMLFAVLVALVVLAGATAAPAGADDPLFVPWSSLLPGLSTQYQPMSSNLCANGDDRCVDAVIQEMTRRFTPLAQACDHNAVFSLTYLRTTEQYRRTIEDPTFFSDTPFINHQDALFAKYYFDAWDSYHAGNLSLVPPAWQLGFDAADHERVMGMGNLLLGMSAHVNRDLPFVLADIGLVKPDGSSRKPDHDKVNVFLNQVIDPLLQEAAQRFDPTILVTHFNGQTLDYTATMQILVAWREAAWRNAEALVNAPTPAARALVAQQIETSAAIEQEFIIAATSYSPVTASAAVSAAVTLDNTTVVFDLPTLMKLVNTATGDRTANMSAGLLPLLGGSAARDAYCATHHG
jgi:hypothetical protein